MIRVLAKQQFGKFKTSLQDMMSSQLGPVQNNDLKQLRVNSQTNLRDVYYSYMKHMRLYEIQGLEIKMISIRDAYMRIISERLKNIDNLTDEEKKDLRFLMDNNFGFPYIEGIRRSELIAKYFEEIESKQFYHYPRLTLFILWLFLGLPSIILYDKYV